jgi:hypothetical protein
MHDCWSAEKGEMRQKELRWMMHNVTGATYRVEDG